MALSNKTLTPAGLLVGSGGNHFGSAQFMEDLYDAVLALEAVAATGDITSVVAGAGLTGGATSGAATLTVGAGTNITVNADDVALATNIDIAGTLDVTGAATLDAALHVVGAATLDAACTVGTTLEVTGMTTLNADANKLSTSGLVYTKGISLNSGYGEAGGTAFYINYYGQNGAAGSNNRSTWIMDGAAAAIAKFTAATKATELLGALSVTGATALSGTVTMGGDAPVATRLLSVGAVAAKSTTVVHALYDDVTAEFPGPFTNPDVPRNLRVTKSTDWDGGTITVVGTDQFDAAVSETFNDVVEVTVGTKIFKTVTSATKSIPAGVAGNGASIGTGDKVGIPIHIYDTVGRLCVGTTDEAVTLDATYDAFTPTTTPAATTYTLLVNVDLSQQ
jgi:hypothetical protein